MIVSTIEIRKITASNGMILTNGEAYGEEVYLGINDTPDNWYEIPQEEYERIMAEQKDMEEN